MYQKSHVIVYYVFFASHIQTSNLGHFLLQNSSFVLNVTCSCKENVAGRTCNRCEAGYYSFPYCDPCSCERKGTTEAVCDQVTAQCLCKVSIANDLIILYLGTNTYTKVSNISPVFNFSFSPTGKRGRPWMCTV